MRKSIEVKGVQIQIEPLWEFSLVHKDYINPQFFDFEAILRGQLARLHFTT